MPDWSYHPLFKPWLPILPGNTGREFIHRGMSLLSQLPGGRPFIEFLGHMSPSQKLSRNLFGLHFDSPVGLSGKIDPRLSGIKAFPNLGFGSIEVGPITEFMRERNSAAYLSKTQDALILPEHAETIGLNAAKEKLTNARTVPILIRLEQSLIIAEHLKDVGDVFIIEFDSIESFDALTHIKMVLGNKPVLLAIRHSMVADNILQLKSASQFTDGFMIEEDRILRDGKQVLPLQQTAGIKHALNLIKNEIDLPVITSGGVAQPADALALFEAGAELVFLTGGYVASGPGLPKRINEALMDELGSGQKVLPGWIWYWLFGLFILIGGAAVLFFSFTKVILFYDEAFMQMTRLELMAYNPNLYKFMSHDRMTLAGTMISGGYIYMQLARHGVKYGIHWTRKAFNIGAITGFLGILLFLGFGYFDWLHGFFWLILLPFYIAGFIKTRSANQSPASKNRTNNSSWKKAVYGQLLLVILGFSFVLGGIVISTIGATSVFVDTDLKYICMTPDQMNELNKKLIPVIAHDRAGFGSALFSVGLLVLTLSLWGFHEGSAWVWRTFLFGGIPAFAAGLFTHFYIGYINFIHLLPAYFALALYIGGLLLTRDYFKKR
ncbi:MULTISPECIES: dihydroorotate dehydrogenase [unclassified Bacillus (in: firmicutes)]|uniref:dihydroorotate dehydrogenase n=1 Tax=unclassified Bacillus (in: firmicutes) TaxID=185979 RepID=UPI001BEA8F45|nr:MULTISPECIES: dihydroorotate dehydrogenase [unclassified Bacillus (in: firmicutes)]MBT2640296.1 dihydroorotate dehydrogenase [Bacillus sp. ISL-39]MBT2662706.1 dihydroorotate dehydrogenase [Bacillus sp. ISL-45]